jgi:hypothetical protein
LAFLAAACFRAYPRLCITVAYSVLAVAAAAPIAFGDRTLGPEHAIDQDGFYGETAASSRHYGDTTPILVDYPRDIMIARSFGSGRPFAWNPLVAAGVPLLAEQGGPFFPLRLVFYLFPGPGSYTLFRMSRMVLAGLGAYALARSRARSRFASFVAGGLFELGGSTLWLLPFAGASAACVVPWLLFGINRLFQGRSRLGVAVTALSVGLMLLGGHPGIAAASLLAGLAAFLGAALENLAAPRRLAFAIGGVTLAVVLGAVVSACSSLPFLELLANGHSYKLTGTGSSVWVSNIAYSRVSWWAGAFAPPLVDRLREASQRYPYNLGSLYGLLTLFLALSAALRARLDVRLGCVALLGVVLTFDPPGFGWVSSLPGVAYILPPYCSMLLALPLTQWAGSGVDVWSRLPRSRIVWRPGPDGPEAGRSEHGVSAPVVSAVALVIALVTAGHLSFDLVNAPLREAIRGVVSGVAGGALVASYLLAAACVALAVGLGRWARRAPALCLGLGALLELVAYDTAHFSEPTSWVLRSGRPAGVAEVERIVRQSHARLASNSQLALPLYNLLDGIPDLRTVAALVPKRYHLYMSLLDGGSFTFYLPGRAESPLLDLADARFAILPNPAGGAGAGVGAAAGGGARPPVVARAHWGLFRNDHALPRARMIFEVHPVPDLEAAVPWLAGAASTGNHASDTVLARQAVVETGALAPATRAGLVPLAGAPAAGQAASASASASASVNFIDDSPDLVTLDVRTGARGLLVLADACYPGWQARVDGVPSEIVPTDVLFRGVLVPAGAHLVTFSYRPLSLWFGLGLSALGLGVVAALFLGRGSAVALRRVGARSARSPRIPKPIGLPPSPIALDRRLSPRAGERVLDEGCLEEVLGPGPAPDPGGGAGP